MPEIVVSLLPLIIVYLVTDLLHSERYVHLDLVWTRMKVLRLALEKKFRESNLLNLYGQNRDARCTSALTYLKVYQVILDMSKFIEYTMTFPASTVYPFFAVFDCLHVVLLPCLPILATERISSEVDKIKLTLMHQIIDTFDSEDSGHQDVQSFLEYVESRPYRYCVWRLFSVDAGLLLGFVSLCITYLIVVIQFTHLL
ncbi:hypothetical protein EVAR_101860_1 [Eumeta japonica]|uniref:Gustatory receptor n=1 Tax=Eumeta variegata TaxID=151549 RepID=A0A4C1SNI0_EUMVA|nr:hypothetical protein EVAR_101860_1 [Eumeta japonica]